MKLTKEQIKSITVGTVDCREDSRGLHFTKYKQEQLAAWEKAAPWLVDNVKASTGIRLDFHTDSSAVTFDVADGKSYDVKIDGILTHHFKCSGDQNRCSYTVELGETGEMKHVVFSLPSHDTPGVICGVAVDDGATVQPHKFDRKLLFLGDSITQGWNSEYDTLSYAYQVSEALNGESVIHGIGGSFFEPTALCNMGYTPDTVFVAFGTNDFNHFATLEEIKNRAKEYLLLVKKLYPQAKIYVISPIWRQDCHEMQKCGTFQQCREVITKTAQSLDLEVIDGMKLVPHHADFMADNVHPNALGFMLYAQNLLKYIK